MAASSAIFCSNLPAPGCATGMGSGKGYVSIYEPTYTVALQVVLS